MPPKSSVGVRGKVLHSQAREIIANVISFMEKEAKDSVTIPVTRFKERVLAATKIGENSYREIKKEAKQVASDEKVKFSSPKKNRNRPNPKSDLLQGELETIRSIIHQYYIIEKRHPTLKGIRNKILNSGIEFQGSLWTLGKIVKKLGFRWRETMDKRKILMESHDIRLKRIQYLEQLQQYVQDERPIIFTDESYINSCHTNKKTWSADSERGFRKPIGKGARVIMVHAGGADGFVKNALLMFKSGSTSGDYHQDMNNAANFMLWVRKQLLPNLPKRAVLVIDNAAYHNVAINKDPTSASTKQVMIQWLIQRGIPHDPNATKPVLYNIIKQRKSTYKQYILDTELAQHGHVVLRLPPYHPELNPIEKIWALVKNHVAATNITCRLNDVIELAQQKFESITAEDWAKVCRHVDRVVEEYMRKEHLLDSASDEFRFTVNTGDSDDDTSEGEFSEDDVDVGISPLEMLEEPGPSTSTL